MKPVDIIKLLTPVLTDKDCIEIVSYLLDETNIIQKPKTIFKIEKIVKSVADFERIEIS